MTTAIRTGIKIDVGLGMNFDAAADIAETKLRKLGRKYGEVIKINSTNGALDAVHGDIVLLRGRRKTVLAQLPTSLIQDK